MAGHSKWANIKHRKAKQDKKRSNIFSKMSRNITIAARDGGDPAINFKLRLAIDKAKQANMPKDNIERAIKKGTGELEGEQIIEIVYEGYGPSGVAFVVEAATDNKNRTAANIRSIFNKNNGSLGASNSVLWMFERKGLLRFESLIKGEDLLLELMDIGAEDIQEEDNALLITTSPEVFPVVKSLLESKEGTIDIAEISLIAQNQVELADKDMINKVERLNEALLDDDDVMNVSTNAQY